MTFKSATPILARRATRIAAIRYADVERPAGRVTLFGCSPCHFEDFKPKLDSSRCLTGYANPTVYVVGPPPKCAVSNCRRLGAPLFGKPR